MEDSIRPTRKLNVILKKLDKKWYRLNNGKLQSCENPERIMTRDLLTETQLKVLKKARILGYYSFPRKINLNKLSKELGTSASTVCVHLQKIESTLMGLFKE